ncbi:hypothetical protein ACWKWC_07395 [Geodermatophilus nigrescens]
MTAGAVRARPAARLPGARSPGGRAATVALVRQVRRGALVVALLCGGLTALVATQYRDLGGTVGAASLTALAENPAIRTLFGPPVGLDTAGGFTVWRTGTVLAVLLGVWAAATAVRLTRGEEEAGRWDLLLAGRLRLRSLVGRALAVVVGATVLAGAAAATGLVLAGAPPAGAAVFGAGLTGVGAGGAALGTAAAQLAGDRRTASGLAVAVLLAGLLVRMVSDGVPALDPLGWLTPYGLLARAVPFAGDRLLPLVVLAALAALPAVPALALAAGRDVGAARLAGRTHRSRASRLVRSLPGLALHRARRPLAGWALGAAAYFLLIGVLATTMTDFLRDEPAFARLAAQAGFAELGSVPGYVSALYTLLALALGAFAASRVAAVATDEAAGRLTLLLALPVGRVRWLLTELATTVAATLALAAVAGLASWAGAAWVGAGLGLGEALAGALSVVPVAVLCLGAATAALGLVPAATLAVGVAPAVGGYLLLVLADTLGWPSGVRALSPFAHLAAVPAEPWDAAGAAGTVSVAVLLAVTGCLALRRRDLRH